MHGFSARIFLFLAPGINFGTRDPKNAWNPKYRYGSGLGLGDVLSKSGVPKNTVLLGNGFQICKYGISRDQNGLYCTWEAFG